MRIVIKEHYQKIGGYTLKIACLILAILVIVLIVSCDTVPLGCAEAIKKQQEATEEVQKASFVYGSGSTQAQSKFVELGNRIEEVNRICKTD